MKKVAISGYFDPIHVGHLEYIELSKKMGDYLIVIVNNNQQCKLKKGKPFMDEKDRMKIVSAIQWVDEVFLSIDTDKTVCKVLKKSNQIFLLMVEIDIIKKFLNLWYVRNMELNY